MASVCFLKRIIPFTVNMFQTNVDMAEEERKDEEKSMSNKDDERKEYHFGVLKQIQLIFGNLAASKLQYYVPRGFWKHFK